MNKSLIADISIIVLVLGGLYVAEVFSNPSPTPVDTTPATQTDSGTASGTYTMADIAKHSNQSSCYTAIRGSVYDLTNWISQHPGGEEAILSICGKDGTDAFVNQHGGMQRQESMLATFKIGTLAQ